MRRAPDLGALLLLLVLAACGSSAPVAPAPTPSGGSVTAFNRILQREGQTVSDGAARIVPLLNDPRPSDPSWRTGVAAVLGQWKDAYQEASTLTPPECERTAFGLYLQSLRALNGAADLTAGGLDRVSASQIDAATTEIAESHRFLSQATSALKAAQC